MIAAWMFAATLFAALVAVAALAAERLLRLYGREGRGTWVIALAAAATWPVIAPAAAPAFAMLFRARQQAPQAVAASPVATFIAALPAVTRGWTAYVDPALLALWASVSIVMLARLALAMRALSRVERSAEPAVIDGVSVFVTPALGPAVFGARRTRVLVPRWLFELDAPLHALVVRHEQEHCRARDPQVTLASAVAIALVPWNAGVWWIARRLRLAMELDCDARVLRRAEHAERYSKLLLFIAQRQSRVRLAPMLAESNSHLSWRIAAMNAPRVRNPRARAAMFAAVAAGAIALSTRFAGELTAAPTVSMPPRARAAQADDRPVMAIPGSPSPRYPEILKSAGVEGAVLLSFVVDTSGIPVDGSLRILRSTHQLFSDAVKATLPNMRFLPAILNGRKVKQAVRQPVIFNMMGSPRSSGGYVETIDSLLAGAPLANFYTLAAVVITAVNR